MSNIVVIVTAILLLVSLIFLNLCCWYGSYDCTNQENKSECDKAAVQNVSNATLRRNILTGTYTNSNIGYRIMINIVKVILGILMIAIPAKFYE